jgi:hypothetical protein
LSYRWHLSDRRHCDQGKAAALPCQNQEQFQIALSTLFFPIAHFAGNNPEQRMRRGNFLPTVIDRIIPKNYKVTCPILTGSHHAPRESNPEWSEPLCARLRPELGNEQPLWHIILAVNHPPRTQKLCRNRWPGLPA